MRKSVLLLASVAIAVLLVCGIAWAEPGDFDVRFDVSRYEYVGDVDPQPDGKVVAIVSSDEGSNYNLSLVRLNEDGTLDQTFGGDGLIAEEDISFHAVTIQANGKILAGGRAGTLPGTLGGLARYNSDGSPDTTFDGDGSLATSIGMIKSIALQGDDKILAAGTKWTDSGSDTYLARYNPDGTLDDTFSRNGKLTTPFDGFSSEVLYLDVMSDGKILMAGSTASSSSLLVLARYNPDGTLDDTFNGDGILRFTVSGYVKDLVVQPSGKFVVTRGPDFTLTRYNTDGTLDRTFGTNGSVTTLEDNVLKDVEASNLVLQPDGKLVAGGSANLDGERLDYEILSRYYPSGRLDLTFGEAGVARNAVNYRSAYESDLEIQEDGKLIWAGWGYDTEYGHSMMHRYLGGEDTTSPKVIKTLPRDDATRVDRGRDILVYFSEDMKAASINGKTVNLYKGAIKPANEVSATVRYDVDTYIYGADHLAILNPSEKLEANTTYRVVVEGAGDGDARAVKDPAGNAMRAEYRWNFTSSAGR